VGYHEVLRGLYPRGRCVSAREAGGTKAKAKAKDACASAGAAVAAPRRSAATHARQRSTRAV
jgi:hypothetical protein